MSTNPNEGVLAPVEEAQLPAHRTEGTAAHAHIAPGTRLYTKAALSPDRRK